MDQLRIRATRGVMRARSIPLHVAGSVLRLLRGANEVRCLALTAVGGGHDVRRLATRAVRMAFRLVRSVAVVTALSARPGGGSPGTPRLANAVSGLGACVTSSIVAAGRLTHALRGIHTNVARLEITLTRMDRGAVRISPST